MIYIPATDLSEWRKLLKDPEIHWKEKYSAAMLATSWFKAGGFPACVRDVFVKSGAPFSSLEPLIILPEHSVALPGGSRPSQSDAWVLARHDTGVVSIAVEGKVSEVFGPTLAEWQSEPSEGKRKRLGFLTELLGLPCDIPATIRYQLLHRTASAVIEAKRFHATMAIMLVHSFSTEDSGLEDYQNFARLFGVVAEPNQLVCIGKHEGISMHIVWVRNPVVESES